MGVLFEEIGAGRQSTLFARAGHGSDVSIERPHSKSLVIVNVGGETGHGSESSVQVVRRTTKAAFI
jgi:hypothetical protein